MHEIVETYRVFPNGYAVRLEFCQAVIEQVNGLILKLPFRAVFTLKALCGPEFWDALSKGEQSKAGRLMSCLVTYREIELEFVGCKHRTSKRYRRR